MHKANTDQARKDGEIDEAEEVVSEIMTINDWRENRKTQMDRHVKIEIDDENWKCGNWKYEIRLGKLFEGYWVEFVSTVSDLKSRCGTAF